MNREAGSRLTRCSDKWQHCHVLVWEQSHGFYTCRLAQHQPQACSTPLLLFLGRQPDPVRRMQETLR